MTNCNRLASENLLLDLLGTEGAFQVELAKEDRLGTGTTT